MADHDGEKHAIRPLRCYSCGHQFGGVPNRLDTTCPACGSDSFTRVNPPQTVLLCETPDGCTCGAPANTPRGMHHDYCAVRNPSTRPSEGQ